MRGAIVCAVCWVIAATPCRAQAPAAPAPADTLTTFNWKGTLTQSAFLLGVQHSLRMLQSKTRKHLAGPFWKDYVYSVEGLRGWNDATVYSTSYELAPWGEAGIGNVGYDRGTMGYIDLVITPLAGFGMIVLEDYIDDAVIKRLERTTNQGMARVIRVVLNPQRSIANLMRLKRPSHRDTRGAPGR